MSLLTVDNRSDEVQEVAKHFEMDHLTHPDSRQIAMAFGRLAQEMIMRIRTADDELVKVLETLHDARQLAISAILPPGRREQFKARDSRGEEGQEEAPAPKPTAPRARAK